VLQWIAPKKVEGQRGGSPANGEFRSRSSGLGKPDESIRWSRRHGPAVKREGRASTHLPAR